MSTQPEEKRGIVHREILSKEATSQAGYSVFVWGWGYEDPEYVKNLSEEHKILDISCSFGSFKERMDYVLTTSGDLKEWNQRDSRHYRRDHNTRLVSNKAVLSNVSSIVSGMGYHVATNLAGEVFTWGIEILSRDEDGTYEWRYDDEPTLVQGLSGVKIKQVGVGWGEGENEILAGHFATALSHTGDVYCWGKNQFGMTGTGKETGEQQEPELVLKNVTELVTFKHHSAAITSDGSLYTWGCGRSGRLGHNSESDCHKPTKVRMLHDIKQVACGDEHTVALTTDGKVYVFGSNSEDQAGQGQYGQQAYMTPTLVDGLAEDRIVKVACGPKSSYAVSEKGALFRWGIGFGEPNPFAQMRQQEPVAITNFLRTQQKIEEIRYLGYSVAVLVTPRNDYVPLTRSLCTSLNDDEFSDVTFVVENELIRAHRLILARRCEYFYKMFTSGMRESKIDQIPLPSISKNTFMKLLKYFYTDEIDIDISNALELFQAADMFDLPKLLDQCAAAVKNKIDTSDAAVFLQQTHECGCEVLKSVAISFVRKNFCEVSQTPGMQALTAELLVEIVRGYNLTK